jgi:replicative DNA helicase
MNKLLPYNHEAECSVIGSILIDQEAIFKVLDMLELEDFDNGKYRILYKILLEIFQNGKKIDLVILMEELTKQG